MKAYHATRKLDLPSIREHGLIAVGSTDDSEQPAVHLGDGLWVLDHVASITQTHVDDLVVLEVDLSGLDVKPGWDGPPALAVYEDIAPERITTVDAEGY